MKTTTLLPLSLFLLASACHSGPEVAALESASDSEVWVALAGALAAGEIAGEHFSLYQGYVDPIDETLEPLPAAEPSEPNDTYSIGGRPLDRSDGAENFLPQDLSLFGLVVTCALGADQCVSVGSHVFCGREGLAPGWAHGLPTLAEQESVTACMVLSRQDDVTSSLVLMADRKTAVGAAADLAWRPAGVLFDASETSFSVAGTLRACPGLGFCQADQALAEGEGSVTVVAADGGPVSLYVTDEDPTAVCSDGCTQATRTHVYTTPIVAFAGNAFAPPAPGQTPYTAFLLDPEAGFQPVCFGAGDCASEWTIIPTDPCFREAVPLPVESLCADDPAAPIGPCAPEAPSAPADTCGHETREVVTSCQADGVTLSNLVTVYAAK